MRTDDLALAAPGRYRLPLVGRHDFDDFWVPPAFDAYALGVWLGDGTTNGSCAEVCKPEPDVIAMFEAGLSASDCLVRGEDGRCRVVRRKRGRDRSVFMRHLETEGLAGKHSHERFVPLHVLRGSDATRRSVLAGLLDTDGYVTSSGRSVEFSTTSSRMLDGVAFIVRSLGGICSVSGWRRNAYRHRGERRIGRPSARLVITFPDGYIPTRSVKHAARWKQGRRTAHRSVVGVEPVPPGHATCISVAAEDGLFVARDFIVTHNTQMVLDICEKRCLDHGEAVLFFSLEMGAEQLHTRLAGARARANPMREDANRHQQARLMKAIGELAEARLFIDETPGIGIGRLRATARAVVRRERVSLVVVDYLQLITHEKAIDNKATEVGEISKALKALARELRVPVVALSQLNRSVEGRADKRPMMSDLRESGSIEQDADVVILLYREEYYLKGGTPGNKVGVAEASVAKHRNGPTGVVNLHFGRHADDPSDAPPRFGSLARGGRDE